MATEPYAVTDADHLPTMTAGRKVDWFGVNDAGQYCGAIWLRTSRHNTYGRVCVRRDAATGTFALGRDETCVEPVACATLRDVVILACTLWEG